MNYSKYWKKLKAFALELAIVLSSKRKHKCDYRCAHNCINRPKLSLLFPFSSRDATRRRNFKWLLEYWRNRLPDAEIIVGKSKSSIFCKGEALNNAMRKSTGKVIVIIDADAYFDEKVLEHCADRILEELEHGNRMWYVPYRHLYRLTAEITEEIVQSDPAYPLRLSCPPLPEHVDDSGHSSKYGCRYGAMCMMFPREAYETLGCFDERFVGWGAEDVALLRALDTLWGKHKTFKSCMFHLWHPFLGEDYRSRMWEGQDTGNVNVRLANRYNRAHRNPSMMRELLDEWVKRDELPKKEKEEKEEKEEEQIYPEKHEEKKDKHEEKKEDGKKKGKP